MIRVSEFLLQRIVLALFLSFRALIMVVISARYAMDRYATGRYEASRNDLRSILKKDCTMGLRRILLAASEQFQVRFEIVSATREK